MAGLEEWEESEKMLPKMTSRASNSPSHNQSPPGPGVPKQSALPHITPPPPNVPEVCLREVCPVAGYVQLC